MECKEELGAGEFSTEVVWEFAVEFMFCFIRSLSISALALSISSCIDGSLKKVRLKTVYIKNYAGRPWTDRIASTSSFKGVYSANNWLASWVDSFCWFRTISSLAVKLSISFCIVNRNSSSLFFSLIKEFLSDELLILQHYNGNSFEKVYSSIARAFFWFDVFRFSKYSHFSEFNWIVFWRNWHRWFNDSSFIFQIFNGKWKMLKMCWPCYSLGNNHCIINA